MFCAKIIWKYTVKYEFIRACTIFSIIFDIEGRIDIIRIPLNDFDNFVFGNGFPMPIFHDFG